MKCPKCKAECWRDEHPDGYAFGLWGCSECDWFECDWFEGKGMEQTKEQDINFNELPY